MTALLLLAFQVLLAVAPNVLWAQGRGHLGVIVQSIARPPEEMSQTPPEGAIILGLVRDRSIHSGSMTIPLELRDPHGLAVLAMIITSTPGTVWQGLSDDRRELTIHVLDLVDETQWVRKIKQRYELPLRSIFE